MKDPNGSVGVEMVRRNMAGEIDLTVEFAGLKLANPVWTASGTSGYADELSDFMDLGKLGGFVTKSVTLKPKEGNPVPRIVETDSGMLNAIGLANVGVDKFIEEKIPLIEKMSCAVFVNVAGETIEDYIAVVQKLCGQNAIAGFELNISCPNVKHGGITFGTEPEVVKEITSAVKAVCAGKVLMVKLTPNVTDIAVTAKAAVDGGADALSLVNTFMAMAIDIESRKPILTNRTGGLSGPAIKPIAVYMVNKVYNEVAKETKVPILGMGGLRTATDAIEFLLAGASAVAVGTANFIEPDTAVKIIDGIKKYCEARHLAAARDLTGALEG
jgi:dihydroorotate dehydrogenase (NAD+) catalytic subunit